jgi:phage shock protein A
MSTAEISQYLGLALAMIALLGHAKGYFSSGERQIKADLETVKTKLIEHDRRIQAVEAELKHLPDKDTVNELKLSLAELKGTVSTLSESMGSVSRTVHRIDDWLREKNA